MTSGSWLRWEHAQVQMRVRSECNWGPNKISPRPKWNWAIRLDTIGLRDQMRSGPEAEQYRVQRQNKIRHWIGHHSQMRYGTMPKWDRSPCPNEIGNWAQMRSGHRPNWNQVTGPKAIWFHIKRWFCSILRHSFLPLTMGSWTNCDSLRDPVSPRGLQLKCVSLQYADAVWFWTHIGIDSNPPLIFKYLQICSVGFNSGFNWTFFFIIRESTCLLIFFAGIFIKFPDKDWIDGPRNKKTIQ